MIMYKETGSCPTPRKRGELLCKEMCLLSTFYDQPFPAEDILVVEQEWECLVAGVKEDAAAENNKR